MSDFGTSAISPVVAGLARTASLPLPAPLRLGSARIDAREYVGIRLEDEDGRAGCAYALTRGAPLAEIVERMLLPEVLGENVGTVAEAWDRMFHSTALVGRVGLVRKAIGLVEIALWDLAGKRAERPVWQLLGNDGAPRRAIVVACYPSPGRPVRDLVREVLDAAAEGWPLLKISRSPDARQMRELLSALDAELGGSSRVIVDVGFGWRDADAALRDLDAWRVPELAWLEDPFLPEDVDASATLRRRSGQRIGVGDEVTDPELLARLGEGGAVDVVRLDVVALGGFSPAASAMRHAHAAGLATSTHVYPEISVHLGTMVETFRRSIRPNPYDPSASLITDGPDFTAGEVTPTLQPGLGFGLDWSLFAGAGT